MTRAVSTVSQKTWNDDVFLYKICLPQSSLGKLIIGVATKKAPIAITDMNRLSGPLMAQYLEKAFKFWVHKIHLHLRQIHTLYSFCNLEISQLENRTSTVE